MSKKKEIPPKEPDLFAIAFGKRLKETREAAEMTQVELGKQVAATKYTVSHWENGVHRPNLEVLSALCDALNCSADDLLGRRRRDISAPALAEARAYDSLPPEQQKKWRAMRLTLFANA